VKTKKSLIRIGTKDFVVPPKFAVFLVKNSLPAPFGRRFPHGSESGYRSQTDAVFHPPGSLSTVSLMQMVFLIAVYKIYPYSIPNKAKKIKGFEQKSGKKALNCPDLPFP